MGNSTCKPHPGGEGLKTFLTRQFGRKGKKKKIDKLVQMALSEDCASLRREAVTVTNAQLDEYYQQMETIVDEYDTEVVELELVGAGIRPRDPLTDGQVKKNPAKTGFMEKILPFSKKKKKSQTKEVVKFIVPKDKKAVIAKAPMPSSENIKSDLIREAKTSNCPTDAGKAISTIHEKSKSDIEVKVSDSKAKLSQATDDKVKPFIHNVKAKVIQVKPCEISNGRCLTCKTNDGQCKPKKDKENKASPEPVVETGVTEINKEPEARRPPVTVKKLYGNERVKQFVYNRVQRTNSFDGFGAARPIDFKKKENLFSKLH